MSKLFLSCQRELKDQDNVIVSGSRKIVQYCTADPFHCLLLNGEDYTTIKSRLAAPDFRNHENSATPRNITCIIEKQC
jgi:hypothetical protein